MSAFVGRIVSSRNAQVATMLNKPNGSKILRAGSWLVAVSALVSTPVPLGWNGRVLSKRPSEQNAVSPPPAAARAKVNVPQDWITPSEPTHIVGPIQFVGTQGLGVYLVTTSAGHILIGGGMPESAPLIASSITKLGYKPEDIKFLLSNHAHFDHVGTLAAMKKLSGGKVAAMAPDVTLLASGGATDYLFANDPTLHFPAVKVDRILKDSDTIELGGVKITARSTPGHTPGCATYMTTVAESGHEYRVVFADCTGINDGTRFVKNPSYPGILEDYRRTFALLESLQPDIFLAYHSGDFDLASKRVRAATQGVQAFVDPDGYRKFVVARKAKFEDLVAKE
jgi:metallo-beta-lactamase class B